MNFDLLLFPLVAHYCLTSCFCCAGMHRDLWVANVCTVICITTSIIIALFLHGYSVQVDSGVRVRVRIWNVLLLLQLVLYLPAVQEAMLT